ncbi:MAG: hypothetical protein H5U15_06215 [Roseovarius sp.]|nr:hypothetical protein [Roseovarius sp.]
MGAIPITALNWLARHARWVLLAGLVLGVTLPWLGAVLQPAITPLITATLVLAALRSGAGALSALRKGLGRALRQTLILQLAMPLAAGMLLMALGLLDTPGGMGALLVLAGAPISGTPGLAVMSGADAGVALRQVVLGTALLPLTALPVLLMLPLFPDLGAVLAGTGRLLAIIAGAATLAALLRRFAPALGTAHALPLIDGAMALAMAMIVIALMGALGPALARGDGSVAGLLGLAFALNLGAMAGVWRATRHRLPPRTAAAMAITAGNRNLAIFLVALPPETMARLLLFVGCFQIPMYLTPLILPRLTGPLRRTDVEGG